MFTTVGSAVMGGIVLDYFNVAGQARAGVGAFDEVVAEKRISRETPVEHLMHCVDFIDPLAGIATFSVKILVCIRKCASVDIEAGLARIDSGEPRTCRALHAHC